MTQQFESTKQSGSDKVVGTNYSVLHQSIEQLIATFGEIEDVIHQQLRAVVENNFEEIVALSEKQLELTYTLNQREQQFQRLIGQIFDDLHIEGHPPSLTNLLSQVTQMREEFDPLREQLLAAIASAQKAQQQLVNLLEFAQHHVSQTLREIYALSSEHEMHYTNNGQKAQRAGLARLINQTA